MLTAFDDTNNIVFGVAYLIKQLEMLSSDIRTRGAFKRSLLQSLRDNEVHAYDLVCVILFSELKVCTDELRFNKHFRSAKTIRCNKDLLQRRFA